ncbi:hypothetical protein GCM10009767_35370 [Kocuria aegyptia]|uniref:Uncharacterized protein n=1 Tax=Kocuria aegyptia TaxID=330943 RepID=A0ABN2L410_9MICC
MDAVVEAEAVCEETHPFPLASVLLRLPNAARCVLVRHGDPQRLVTHRCISPHRWTSAEDTTSRAAAALMGQVSSPPADSGRTTEGWACCARGDPLNQR